MAAWNCLPGAVCWAGVALPACARPESTGAKPFVFQLPPGCGWRTASVGRSSLGDYRKRTGGRTERRLNSAPARQGQAEARTVEEPRPPAQGREAPPSPAEVVREFYDLINRRDYIAVANLFADDCEYQDFNFSESKRGKERILQFFQTVMTSFGTDLKFVIDDMTTEDPSAVGVIWHLDWRGKVFPFSRGCSFYRCEVNDLGDQQIKFARDIVEPASKPGNIAMGLLRLVTALFERFPKLADGL